MFVCDDLNGVKKGRQKPTNAGMFRAINMQDNVNDTIKELREIQKNK